ncbi:MAG: hypothetical protein A2275_14735 [Bacteroidetes bacterium RIFOXYA12_FULL_35_11]|nr:MAG: hypothetical protein A2X01_00435 [Bacteroidetes bacterium GWF2_35_48]OFY73599.1 MAG: hypothetical protein A2275_14735 [Bacteroidetes bacterium RIFOXYA12_FULL_35_11]OFY94314.1 MAG: hypothetical protein A2491_00045 [Bacteroidetes bacterium RIFOXYC12_FULL_35_7]HBX51395.1 hypothetical protein [Bacteroidales bacterium]
MEDSKIAKLLISSIIKQEIEILEFSPKEFVTNVDYKSKKNLSKNNKNKKNIPTSFTVYRLDFTAKIRTSEGDKVVIIEIQKAKFATDILRFRKYLGEQYSNKKNVYYIERNGKSEKRAFEIISIYFLGHELENIHGVPVIKSEKKYIDLSNGKEIKQKEYFIDSLNHESYTILIPELKEKRRNELEKLLSIFDQSNITENDHILNVNEKDFPEKYQSLIRRLQKAATVPEIRKNMDAEDEIIDAIAELERQNEQEIAIRDKIIEDKQKTIEDKQKTIEDKQKLLESKDKLIKELEKKLSKKK